MENQHRAITGYRELSQAEINAMNTVKEKAEEVGKIVDELKGHGDLLDQRWVSEGKTDLQKGFMSLVRAIAKPTTFVFAFLLLVGCGGKYQYLPIEGNAAKGEQYHYKVQTSLANTHFFAGVPQDTEYLHCTKKIDPALTEEEREFPFRGCTAVKPGTYAHNVSPGAANFTGQVVSTGMMAGGIAYAGYAVGKGLGRSGNTTNNNNDNDTNSDANATGGDGGQGGAGGAGGAGGNSSLKSNSDNISNKIDNSKHSITQTNNNSVKIGK